MIHQIGVPYHWGGEGISTGDSGNDLTGVVMDPNVHIQESQGGHLRHPAGTPSARAGAGRATWRTTAGGPG